MEAKELMVGDLIRYTQDQCLTDEDKAPLTVTCVGEPEYPDYMPFVKIKGSNELYHQDLFEPIPFTAEIFETNEFKRKTFNGTIIYSKHSSADIHWYDVIVEIGKDAEGIQRWDCVCIKIQKAGANLTLNNQSCFHQLQHALRLVGLNEVADNLKV